MEPTGYASKELNETQNINGARNIQNKPLITTATDIDLGVSSSLHNQEIIWG
jgi:hypothetical protein